MTTQRTVLIIDDEKSIREMLSHLLRRRGFQVATAAEGWEALEYLRNSTELPCLTLLDLRMPGMDGWKFRTVQRADPRLQGIPVIVITSANTTEADIRSIDAAAYVKKPIHTETLISTIQEHLSSRKAAA